MKIRQATLLLTMTLCLLPAAASADFSWDIQHTGSVNDFFEIEAFHTFVTNNASVPDTVTVNMVKNLPAGWVASLCEELLCYPPFRLDIDLILAPGQTTELIIDITPVTTLGKGSTLITLASRNNPAETAAATFAVVSKGLDVLLVNATGSGADEARLTAAINTAGKTTASWDPSVMGKAAAADLAQFASVVWAAGAMPLGLDAVDRSNLSAYVAGGGQLLLSGQNLAYASCDPASPTYGAAALAWFGNTLGVDYVANLGGTASVSGTAANPVFPSAFLAINGGDGSNNNTSADRIAATGNGVSLLTYETGHTALVMHSPVAGRTAFAAFGVEGISSATDRAYFMSRVFAWFAGQATAVGDDLVPVLARRAEAWPNPFNPRTTIAFEVGGAVAVPASVSVHDLRGRLVQRLFEGTMQPGPRQLTWDGRDDGGRNLAAGVYLAEIRIAGERQTVKLTLAK